MAYNGFKMENRVKRYKDIWTIDYINCVDDYTFRTGNRIIVRHINNNQFGIKLYIKIKK